MLIGLACGLTVAAQAISRGIPQELQAAQALAQQGRFNDAKTAVLAELQGDPSSVEAWNLLGIIETEQQDYPSALAAFQKALQLAPNSVKTYNNLGNLLLAQKEPGLAERAFRSGLRIDTQNRDGNYNLGVLLIARGLPAEAIVHFERVRPSDPCLLYTSRCV